MMSKNNFNWKFFKRFWKVTFVIFPSWRSVTVLLFLLLLCIVLLEQYITYNVGLIPSQYYVVLGGKDLSGFKRLTVISLLVIVSQAFVVATKKYVCSVFYVSTRSLLTKHLHSGYFTDIVYYRINILDKSIDNPDQRITQDVERMCRVLSSIIADLLISPFAIAYYTYKTWTSMGYIGPVSVFAFFIISTIINKFLMSPVVSLVFKQEQMEGNFRFKHMQIRSNCESAAFYRCGQLEHKQVDQKLNALTSIQQRLNFRQYLLNFSIGLADYVGSILSYIILAIPIFGGMYDDLTPVELSALISQNAFVTIYLIFCFTRLIDMAIQVSDIAGTTHRIIQLDEKIGECKSKSSGYDLADASVSRGAVIGPGDPVVTGDYFRRVSYDVIRADNLCYSAPNGDHKPLLKNLTFQLRPGVNVLVTGDSGCGKSSLFRVLDGLWPHSRGSISRNIVRGYQGILILPQKPYLTDGTLRQQIAFPYSVDALHSNREPLVDDDQLLEYLGKAGLSEIFDRTGGFDCPVLWNWHDVLSPGEMQRLSFVRLFYHQPPFALLDEATSQVSLAMEHTLYSLCQQLNITLLSIGHRDSLRQFHHQELRFEGDGRWSLREIACNSTESLSGAVVGTDCLCTVRF